tara:strand:- start:493 stop:753 length:261 start_codon:yes stop_codon:yes gene_type:complete
METNAKIKSEQIFKDLCKIITAPSGQDARVSDIDKIVAKNCAIYLVDKIIETEILIDEDIYVETPSYLHYWQEVKQEINKLTTKNK